ncbi:MAG: SUMF1/EgtB/PvdO family nonheme iron enzyme [Solobacterium sp.]|nr:SUMF1/EgtB/PvdO family nonheme iron enzyme [Solobacterium sp.]
MHDRKMARHLTDICMTIALLCLMAYQVTGEMAHEWIGIGMTVLVVIHQILNRRWYGALLKGKYNAYRMVSTGITIALLLSFAVTAFCGMSMSGYAVPFLYGMASVSFARSMHLSMSHWSFVLMGVHLGLHIPAMTAAFTKKAGRRNVLSLVFCGIAAAGFFFFLKNSIPDYMLFRVPFAFLDYEKSWLLVFLENILILLFWAFIGTETAVLFRNRQKDDQRTVHPVLLVTAAVLTGLAADMIINRSSSTAPADTGSPKPQETAAPADTEQKSVDDGFILISGGTFRMGSPETENWRIEDETPHDVTVSAFYMDPYETTQMEYTRLTGETPFAFSGDDLPAENISWLEAVRFANAKSTDEGLTPVYTVTEEGVSWDLSADGYRLPTEAEWEYACRAGTLTPFNTEKSMDATEANFYGHYPYEIEENYFDNSVLEAKPGEYRQTTVKTGSFEPNVWGLYDMHGNVNEWCWDHYGAYDTAAVTDPTGPASGTRHIYRGGGWNDFAKNMRSAYRAAGQEDMRSYNLGIRLVRNAAPRNGIVKAYETVPESEKSGKILIAYFSWGGNTRGAAEEIRRQTGADIFEIVPAVPYSTDYSTVLMEAQEDQHRQARPELSDHVENMEDYEIVLLGYPNWWASIPMPVASFLEEYDFSGKTILPFCSHGGGRFGQSLTAIAKLAPDAVMGEGLSIHYSGGAALPDDVSAWLDANGIEH